MRPVCMEPKIAELPTCVDHNNTFLFILCSYQGFHVNSCLTLTQRISSGDLKKTVGLINNKLCQSQSFFCSLLLLYKMLVNYTLLFYAAVSKNNIVHPLLYIPLLFKSNVSESARCDTELQYLPPQHDKLLKTHRDLQRYSMFINMPSHVRTT